MGRKKRIKLAAFISCILSLLLCLPVFAATDSAGNVFDAGDSIVLPETPFFGAFALGEKVSMTGSRAEGSVAVLARVIAFSGNNIGESVYLGGETIVLNSSEVAGNILACGKQISISGNSNGIYAAGRDISFNGNTNGLYIISSKADIKGNIDGDVYVSSNLINIDPDANITGNLTVKSSVKPDIPETANIGSYKYIAVDKSKKDKSKTASSHIAKKTVSTIYWIIAMSLLGLILCKLFNEHIIKAGEFIMERRETMIKNGILAWILTPIIALLMCCTIILAPAGGILMIAYILSVCVCESFAGASISRLLLPDMNTYIAAVIGIAVIVILNQLPFIGTIVCIISDMYLLAYVTTAMGDRKKNSAGQPA